MNKQVPFNKPKKDKLASQWVEEGKDIKQQSSQREKMSEKTKRLTLDIPESWHKKMKAACAEKGVKMNEEILPLLDKHFKLSS
jgi:hypothetical protein